MDVSCCFIDWEGLRRHASGDLATTPGVLLEAAACRVLENSESAPRAGCTDNTTSLDRYATLATVKQ